MPSTIFLSTPSARRATVEIIIPQIVQKISIHALRKEGDLFSQILSCRMPEFLSTPSARRATVSCPFGCTATAHFYPRPPQGGRQPNSCRKTKLSIFLSTPSARRATAVTVRSKKLSSISIHALRKEGDTYRFARSSDGADFYPRPPQGGRHELRRENRQYKRFLSTPSARRATIKSHRQTCA